MLKKLALATALTLTTAGSAMACSFENTVPIKHLSAAFEAWKAVTDRMAECGNFTAELDQEFRNKQPTAFAANPALYHIGGVSNGTITPLLADDSIRPLDDLVEKYGQQLNENQLIRINGRIMAIAMMVNTQHLVYRADILDELGISVPTTYDEFIAAAEEVKESGKVRYPVGATMMTGWNLSLDFINMYIGYGGEFFTEDSMPSINNEAGVRALETMKTLTQYMDPEYAVSDSTYLQRQLQQGDVALANFWASRAGAMDDEAESTVVGKVNTAAAPLAIEGGRPATTMWWDGIVIARNISDEEAEAAFRLAMEGMSPEMARENAAAAIWLIDGYEPGRLAQGAIDTLQLGPVPYPTTAEMGLMHTAIGNNIADFLIGSESAEQSLADAEAAYITAAREAGLIQ